MHGSRRRRASKKMTIQDVARLAGVSKATVSRVLNHHPGVQQSLQERVMRVVLEYDFVPNLIATGLASGNTHLIGVLAPPLTWPAIPAMMGGVARYIEDTPYEVVLYSIGMKRDHSDVLDRILAMKIVAGLLALLPGKLSPHLVHRFHQGLPVVMINDQEEPAALPWIGVDNRAGAYTATRHLLDMGHCRIAHIMGPRDYYCAVERYEGYRQALLEAGIVPVAELLFQGNFEIESGRQCARELFGRPRENWPGAIFCGNDEMAYGVLEVAEQMGIAVPGDIAVVGFDDNIPSAHVHPPLTTIHQPFFEMGYKAVEMLLSMIKSGVAVQGNGAVPGSAAVEPAHILLPTSLVVRASSAVAPANAAVIRRGET